jgi:hypothetical protein
MSTLVLVAFIGVLAWIFGHELTHRGSAAGEFVQIIGWFVALGAVLVEVLV